MKAKILGLALATALSLTAQAETYNFTPIIDTNDAADNAVAVRLGDQLTMTVTDGGNDNALFTFSNSGGIDSVLTGIYFDDNPSSLFSRITVAGDSGAGVDFRAASPSPLPGGNIPTFSFGTTQTFSAIQAAAANGVDNGGAGESLTLSAALNAGRSFADVISSLNAGDEVNKDFLRVGLRVLGVNGLEICGDALSYLDKGAGGASPPPPIPEPETYGMLLAGLGLMTAVARRRRQG